MTSMAYIPKKFDVYGSVNNTIYQKAKIISKV